MSENRNGHASGRLFEMLESVSAEAPLLLDGKEGNTVRYGELRSRVLTLAHGLHEKGLRRGERLALMLPNGADWLTVVLACSRLGVAVVSLNVRLGAKEVGELIGRTGARALVYPSRNRSVACVRTLEQVSADSLASLRMVISAGDGHANLDLPAATTETLDALENGEAEACNEGRGEDACLVLATSGTTGRPKLVAHAQGRVCDHVGDAARTLRLDAESRLLVAIPFCGAFGYTLVMTALHAGCSIVMMDAFDARRAGELIRQYDVTHALGTNDMLQKMLQADSAPTPFPSLFFYGHANFTPGLVDLPEQARRRSVHMRGFFGMSETLALFAAQPEDADLERRREGGGIPVCPQARVRVRDLDSGRLLDHSQVGELEVLSPNVMLEYLNDPENTARAFTEDGYLRTGDLGYTLDDGGFIFTSRDKDVLRIGGYLVAPAEIEDVIRALGPVTACQVVAVEQSQGVRPVAFVVAEAGAEIDEAALRQACRDSLATYKVPIRIFVLDTLPATDGPNGAKVKKHVLRNWAHEWLQEDFKA